MVGSAYDRSGTDVNATPLTINLAAPTFNASLTWVASVLAHESVHAALYLTRRPCTELAAEQEANAYQRMVLRRIGAPQSEITYMLSQSVGHYDLSGDGKYNDLRSY